MERGHTAAAALLLAVCRQSDKRHSRLTTSDIHCPVSYQATLM